MGRKVGLLCPILGAARSPSNIMSPGPRSTSLPSHILIHPAVWPQQTWAKNGGLCLFSGGAGSPSNTVWPCQGLPPYQVSSWSIQPFGHNTPTSQTDRTDRQTGQQYDSISQTFYKRSPQNQFPFSSQLESTVWADISYNQWTADAMSMTHEADLKRGVSKRTESLLDKKLKLTVLSLELIDSLLQLQTLRPYVLNAQTSGSFLNQITDCIASNSNLTHYRDSASSQRHRTSLGHEGGFLLFHTRAQLLDAY